MAAMKLWLSRRLEELPVSYYCTVNATLAATLYSVQVQ
jgi:hypothetical protein